MWVGVDDTDSPEGGCTTYTLTEVIRAAGANGLDVIGEPRLVRLDPNVPTKTRGNAALAVRFGHGRGERRRRGAFGDETLWSFAGARPPSAREFEACVEDAWGAVRRTARWGSPGTDPVMVAARHRPPAWIYREAVSRWLPLERLGPAIERWGPTVRAGADRGGLVGASAALAWPARRATWELIAYRTPDRWGTTRRVDAESVRAAQRRFPELFLCHDARTRRLLVAPHTACPILFGLRAHTPEVLERAARSVVSEPVERWMIFRTNQGTGDHLQRRKIGELRPYDAARLSGEVADAPERHPGGHVSWTLRDAEGAVADCWAFEPTKTLPKVAAQLRAGDRIEVWGGRGADAAFRVEGIVWRGRPRGRAAGRAPTCPRCARRARSAGRGRGYRCRGCRLRFAPEAGEPVDTLAPSRGPHHPTPSARRHLAPIGPEVVAVT